MEYVCVLQAYMNIYIYIFMYIYIYMYVLLHLCVYMCVRVLAIHRDSILFLTRNRNMLDVCVCSKQDEVTYRLCKVMNGCIVQHHEVKGSYIVHGSHSYCVATMPIM